MIQPHNPESCDGTMNTLCSPAPQNAYALRGNAHELSPFTHTLPPTATSHPGAAVDTSLTNPSGDNRSSIHTTMHGSYQSQQLRGKL